MPKQRKANQGREEQNPHEDGRSNRSRQTQASERPQDEEDHFMSSSDRGSYRVRHEEEADTRPLAGGNRLDEDGEEVHYRGH